MADQLIDTSVSVMVSVCPATFAVAVANEKTITVAYANVAHERTALAASSSHLVFQTDQTIRCILFLNQSRGLLAVGGDNKIISIYDVSSQTAAHKVAQYGPHAKRITGLVGVDGTNAFCFVDKFGECYYLRFKTPTHPTDGLMDPVFMMQHMSIVVDLVITSPSMPSGRRLVTADRDCHLRVSKFPNAFDIEHFLWRESPQAVACALTEFRGAASALQGAGVLLVAGSFDGTVASWILGDDGSAVSGQCDAVKFDSPILALGEVHPHGDSQRRSSELIVFVDGVAAVHAIKFDQASRKLRTDAIRRVALPNEDAVAAVSKSNVNGDLVVLLRSGQIGVLGFGATAEIHFTPFANAAFQAECAKLAPVIASADLQAVWRSTFQDPKARKAAGESDDDNEGGAATDKLEKKIAKKE